MKTIHNLIPARELFGNGYVLDLLTSMVDGTETGIVTSAEFQEMMTERAVMMADGISSELGSAPYNGIFEDVAGTLGCLKELVEALDNVAGRDPFNIIFHGTS